VGSREFSVLAVCYEAEGDDVYCTLSGRVFSFWWAESFIGEEMDEALVHLGETWASRKENVPGGYTLKGRQGHLGRRISRAAEARICFLMDVGVGYLGGGGSRGF